MEAVKSESYMKKAYIKPEIKKFRKGQEVHSFFEKIGFVDVWQDLKADPFLAELLVMKNQRDQDDLNRFGRTLERLHEPKIFDIEDENSSSMNINPSFLVTEAHEDSAKDINLEYTVKSIIIAYFYMYKKGIYPIPEISEVGKKIQFYKKLADTYGLSFNSFRINWPRLENKNIRITKSENILLALKLLETFDDPNIKEVIELANSELKESELKI